MTVLAFAGRSADAAWLEPLRRAMPEFEIVDMDDVAVPQSVDIAIVTNPDPTKLARLTRLRLLHAVWAGVEKLVPLARTQNVPLVRLVDPTLSQAMAEAVLAWTLYLHRDMPRYAAQQRERMWVPHEVVPASARRVSLLGLGEMGRAAARGLRQAGFEVTGWSQSPKELDGVRCLHGAAGLLEALASADILVLLLPLTPHTLGLMNAAQLAVLPRGASLINFARGGVLDHAALLAALASGHLTHAVLDVFDEEPLPPQSTLWHHPAITVLPHISAPTNKESASAIVAENIRRFRASGTLPPLVDVVRGY
jgi:glyoxylate/hydroxypyruvate reductase A